MGSSRLPGKALADICGKPCLERIVERVRLAKSLDGVCVATTYRREDRAIRDLANAIGVGIYQGPESDVRARILEAAQIIPADRIVFINGDSPLTDPAIINRTVAFCTEDVDYVSSHHGTWCGYPDGFSVEAFWRRGLETMIEDDRAAREHVTLSFYDRREWEMGVVTPQGGLAPPNLHLSLDTAADLELLRDIFSRLPEGFSYEDVMALLRSDPELLRRATR
jgi:spore coat polysaccharide biosynthesis protein SpsF